MLRPPRSPEREIERERERERDMRLLGHCLFLLLLLLLVLLLRLYCVLFLIFEIAAAAVSTLFVLLLRRKYLSFSGGILLFSVFSPSREVDDCTRSEIYYGAAIVPQATVPLPSLFPEHTPRRKLFSYGIVLYKVFQ